MVHPNGARPQLKSRYRTTDVHPAQLVRYADPVENEAGLPSQLLAARYVRGFRTRSQKIILTVADWLPILAVVGVSFVVDSYWLVVVSAAIVVTNVLHVVARPRAAEQVARPEATATLGQAHVATDDTLRD